MPASTPTDPSEHDASPDDPDESLASDQEGGAVVRTAVDALASMLGPVPTDDWERGANALDDDSGSGER